MEYICLDAFLSPVAHLWHFGISSCRIHLPNAVLNLANRYEFHVDMLHISSLTPHPSCHPFPPRLAPPPPTPPLQRALDSVLFQVDEYVEQMRSLEVASEQSLEVST